jgi:hypothetical protein
MRDSIEKEELVKRQPEKISQIRIRAGKRSLEELREIPVNLAPPSEGAIDELREQGSIPEREGGSIQPVTEKDIGIGLSCFYCGENFSGQLSTPLFSMWTRGAHLLQFGFL